MDSISIAVQLDLLSARSTLYAFVSALFSNPDSEKFALLRDPVFQENVRSSCYLLYSINVGASAMGGVPLPSVVEEILSAVFSDAEIHREYVGVFGHTLSKDTSPYELEFLKNKEVFAMTQTLADINGFYRAFGVSVTAGERADHLAIEAEFLSYLILKERFALENGDEENAEVCRNAQKDFWTDHFCSWVSKLSRNLQAESGVRFYRIASLFLQRFLEMEENH